jgi:hypothetical protein
MMPEQRVSESPGVISSRWGNSPQEEFVGILNNAAKGQTRPRGPVRDRGFVVLVRNTESLQAVQRWCLQQTWNDCLAARYRIESEPVFGTLFAALSDDVKEIQIDGLPGLKRYGSVLFRKDSDWPQDINRGRFQGLTDAIDGAVSPDNMSGMLPAAQTKLRT